MLIAVLLVIAAVIVLYFGAEFSLEASEKIGAKLGMSPLLIGMLLIGLGTSLPEFFVGHIAVLGGNPSIAVGSLIGSNIANMFLILGICGLIIPISIKGKSLLKQLFIHLGLCVTLFWIVTRPSLDIVGTSALLGICAFYIVILFQEMRGNPAPVSHDEFSKFKTTLKLIAGFAMLYCGGELLVKGGMSLCSEIGVSEYIVSAIFIAFGTSFPELVTALMACFKRKDTDLIVGNIIGSNLFNCALILGSLGVYNISFSGDYRREIYALIFGGFVLVLLGLLKKNFSKLVGVIFVGSYGLVVASWLKAF